MNRLRLAALALALAVPVSAMSADTTGVPVVVGQMAEFDACGGWAEVRGLNPGGDGFLAVRSGPGPAHAIRDRLHEGDAFYVCGESRGGEWFSIVYPRRGQTQSDCGVSSALPEPVDYRGPCAYGWVHSRWVHMIAG